MPIALLQSDESTNYTTPDKIVKVECLSTKLCPSVVPIELKPVQPVTCKM